MNASAVRTVDVCICTFRREQVTFTLRSLAEMTMPENCQLRIIVADNDTSPSAQVMVATAAETYGLTLTYLHAPAANISIARNACLDAATADYVAFIDDDEIVSQSWLSEMLLRQHESSADVVLGPVYPIYPDGSASWLVAGNFHATLPVTVGGKIITGYTGNVLMRRDAAALRGLRFDIALGVSGGEDTDFFSRAHRADASIAHAKDAAVFEAVPKDRTNLRWLLKRRTRYGQTHAQQLAASGPRIGHILMATTKATFCFLRILLTPPRWRHWLLRGTLHISVARSLITGNFGKAHVH